MKLKVTEQQILNSILEFLMLRKIPHAHIRNTGSIVRKPDGNTFFAKPKFHQKGVADILGVFNTHPFAIEVKSETGRISEDQAEWLRSFSNEGGSFIVARSVDHVVEFLSRLNKRVA